MFLAPPSLRNMFLTGWILAVFSMTALAEDKPLFEDKFSRKLAEGWTWVDEVPGSWQASDSGLELKVLPVGEGLWGGGRKHPNLLLRDPGKPGDYAVEVQIKSQPTSQFEHAGLILFADGDNYVMLNKEMFEKPEVTLIMEKGAKPVRVSKPYEHEAICLRLTVAGKKAMAQYRHYDTDEWQTLGEYELPVAGPYKIGVQAGQPPKDADHRALFTQFRILPATAVAVATGQPTKAGPELKKRPIRTDIALAVQARQAADRAIPYIEKDGTAWIKDRKCLSCHYAGYMLWSFHDARERGFNIDQAKFAEWTKWSLSQDKNHGAEGAAQSLLARDRSDAREDTVKLIAALGEFIISKQEKDGLWKPGGQLPSQKRPLSETTQVSTMLCLLGLATIDQPNEKTTLSRDKAVAWIKNTPPNGKDPAVSGEWYTMRLLVEKKFGVPKAVEALRDQILAAQQSDGGWGWLWADKSDAFGTGLALYALAEGGVPSSHPAIEKAWKFLIETQTDDGSWIVHGTKTGTKDKPHPMSSFWGSTWALMGLSKSLPDAAIKAASAAQ
ncbi:MAG: 2,3-oxidosqualene cyclase [Planctomycetaceae bacterium]|nr:2,3-oxidosqualene cyclase [Planctomycetaceae bacterium]